MSIFIKIQKLSPLTLFKNKFISDFYRLFLAIAIILSCSNTYADEKKSISPPIPLKPENAIIEAFRTYDIVALGEGSHTNEQSHSFRMDLINNPNFPKAVNDIVVEFGNSYYQPIMDRFISGEDVSHNEIRKAWLFTTQLNQTLDNPVYEEFFYKVRAINKTLPESQRLRVWLGDPPMNWNNIHTKNDLNAARKYLHRDNFAVHLIKYQILAQGRKAILLWGDRHLHRKFQYWKFKDVKFSEKHFKQPNTSIVTQLEQAGARVFSITTNTRFNLASIHESINNWAEPSLSLLKGNVLGAVSYSDYYPFDYSFINQDGIRERVKSISSKSPPMEEEYDAILYLGPLEAMSNRKLPKAYCQDEEYIKIRLKSLGFMRQKKILMDFCNI